ncbi:hypothetical protein RhiXN_04432 [Rhizoctonia solani]|uniref:Uncharacterized protein n=1 Tax=Rhizoctonia solani TaxID=456999 RepID=A0A8H8NQ52_9AGAM|nr:uncharacterized protein RhiXN_04432 [Rhizoctonia solani]QRW16431.1 hypothetical protein RhiXN_04432 [Rhizoctonia solani]
MGTGSSSGRMEDEEGLNGRLKLGSCSEREEQKGCKRVHAATVFSRGVLGESRSMLVVVRQRHIGPLNTGIISTPIGPQTQIVGCSFEERLLIRLFFTSTVSVQPTPSPRAYTSVRSLSRSQAPTRSLTENLKIHISCHVIAINDCIVHSNDAYDPLFTTVTLRPRRYALHPSFKLQPPPISLKTRTTIIEEGRRGRPNKTFADAVAGRNPPEPAPAPIASSSTMTFGDK